MSIWSYDDIARNPSPFLKTWSCPFCRATLSQLHKNINLESPLYGCIDEDVWRETTEEMFICQTCGWWRFEKRLEENFVELETLVCGAVASLRELDLSDISLPIQHIRDYLAAKYEKRFEIHPRLFEETVASVFRDLGYSAQVTGYGNDGGIDVILYKNEELIGVQVKRYKARIEVEQLRSLAGALVLSGTTRGVFVTTSEFRSGCEKTTHGYRYVGMQIELMNANDFYDALGIAQRNVYRSMDDLNLNQIRECMITVEDDMDHLKDWLSK